MRDTVRKWIYLDPIDMERFEAWLEAMAQKGLLFERLSYWGAVFRRGKPAPIRYRLEPAGRLWTRESKDYCRELGWDYLGQVGRHFELYANSDVNAPELHTDSVVKSYALETLSKRIRWYAIALACLTLVLLLLFLLPLLQSPTPILTYLVESASAGNLYLLLPDLAVLIMLAQTYTSFLRLRRQLQKGEYPKRDGSWRRSLRWRMLPPLAALILLLWYLILLAAVLCLPWSGQLEGQSRPIPVLSLAELEENPALGIPQDMLANKNYVSFRWTPAAPEQYHIRQQLSDGAGYEPALDIYWYRLAIPSLASPLLDELIERYSGNGELHRLNLPGLEQAVLAANAQKNDQRLFVQKGNLVVYLDYSGQKELSSRPDLIEKLCQFDA